MNTNPDEATLALWLDDELHGEELAAVEAWAADHAGTTRRPRGNPPLAGDDGFGDSGIRGAAVSGFFQQPRAASHPRADSEAAAAEKQPFSWKSWLMPMAACAGMALAFWVGTKTQVHARNRRGGRSQGDSGGAGGLHAGKRRERRVVRQHRGIRHGHRPQRRGRDPGCHGFFRNRLSCRWTARSTPRRASRWNPQWKSGHDEPPRMAHRLAAAVMLCPACAFAQEDPGKGQDRPGERDRLLRDQRRSEGGGCKDGRGDARRSKSACASEERLRFKNYRLLGQDVQPLLRSYESWAQPLKPSDEVLVRFEARSRPTTQATGTGSRTLAQPQENPENGCPAGRRPAACSCSAPSGAAGG